MALFLKGDEKKVKVSVVIPVFNRAALVGRAVESVLAQSRPPDEIIVVDDGSTDDTREVLRLFGDDITLITQENSGVSSARNCGIESATSEWIAFLDSDDIWMREKLESQLAYHLANPSLLFSHTGEIWMREGKQIAQKKRHRKPRGLCFTENLNFCKIAPSTVMIHHSVLKNVGLFDTDLKVCEDYDLWLRILKKYPIGLIEEPLSVKYAGNHNQLSFQYRAMDYFRILALVKHLPDTLAREEIEKKLCILEQGAQKHANEPLLSFCESIYQQLKQC